MPRQPRQQWQPISRLPILASLIDGMLETSQRQHQDFLQIKSKPHVLDDPTVDRVTRVYMQQISDLRFYERQLKRWWGQENLTDRQRAQVEHVTRQLSYLRETDRLILALLREVKKGTINRIMEMSDVELGIKMSGLGDTLTDRQLKLANSIDAYVKNIVKHGGGDADILQNMYDHMATFKELLDTSTQIEMDVLCAKYEGFYRFAMLLESMAKAIQDGRLTVPK
ncbi:MAG: hypothetical protein JXB07_04425 [Anaerolineae bacterium]|nr:hypothetical protein [Anaerolineae bacterium]